MLRTVIQPPVLFGKGMLLAGVALVVLSTGCAKEPDTNIEQEEQQQDVANTPEPSSSEDSGPAQQSASGNTPGSGGDDSEGNQDPEGLADPELRLILGVDPLPPPAIEDLLRPTDMPLVFGLEEDVERAPFSGSSEQRYNAMRLRPRGTDAYGVALELFMMRNTRDARLRFDALREGSLGSIQRVDVGTEGFVNEGPGLLRIHVLDYATRTIFMISCSSEERCNAAQLMRQSSIVLDRLRAEGASN